MLESLLKLGTAVQDTSKNNVTGRDTGVEWDAQDIRKIPRRGTRSANYL